MKAQKITQHGTVTAYGATTKDAKLGLEKQIDHLCQHAGDITIEFRFGRIITLWPQAEGWSYTIIDPADADQHGKQHYSSCCMSGDRLDALASARMHVAQNQWSQSVKDDAAFVESAQLGTKAVELAKWIAWQRDHYESGFWLTENAPGSVFIEDHSEFNRWDHKSGPFPDIATAREYARQCDRFKRGGAEPDFSLILRAA
jgi:hypothetical protein